MYGFKIVPFDPMFIKVSELREQERKMLRSVSAEDAARALTAMADDGPGWSVLHNGIHIASGGALPISPGVGEVWQFPTIHVPKHMVSYSKVFRHYLREILEKGNFRRLQTSCPVDDLHDRWMRFLGFECEGVMRRYGFDGTDRAIWARLPNGN